MVSEKTVEFVKNRLEQLKEHDTDGYMAWHRVERMSKADGTDYATFSRNFSFPEGSGCIEKANIYTTDDNKPVPNLYIIRVKYKDFHDSIPCFKFIPEQELTETDGIEDCKRVWIDGVHGYYIPKKISEIFEEIRARENSYKEDFSSAEYTLENLLIIKSLANLIIDNRTLNGGNNYNKMALAAMLEMTEEE